MNRIDQRVNRIDQRVMLTDAYASNLSTTSDRPLTHVTTLDHLGLTEPRLDHMGLTERRERGTCWPPWVSQGLTTWD